MMDNTQHVLDTTERARGEFFEILELLLDRTDVLSRSEWATVLGVTDAAISQCIRGTTIPRAEHLRMIVHYLETIDNVPRDYLLRFYEMAQKPAESVGIRNRRLGSSVGAYLVKPRLDGLLLRLQHLHPIAQEQFLDRAADLVTEIESVPISSPTAAAPSGHLSGSELPGGLEALWHKPARRELPAAAGSDHVLFKRQPEGRIPALVLSEAGESSSELLAITTPIVTPDGHLVARLKPEHEILKSGGSFQLSLVARLTSGQVEVRSDLRVQNDSEFLLRIALPETVRRDDLWINHKHWSWADFPFRFLLTSLTASRLPV